MATIAQELLGNLSGNDSNIDGRALNPGPGSWVKVTGTSNVDAIDSSPDYLTGSNSTATAVYRTDQVAPSRNDEVEVTIRWTSFANAFAGVLLGLTGPTGNFSWYGFYVNGSSPYQYRINKLDSNAAIDYTLEVTQATAGVSLSINTDYQMRLTRVDNGDGTVTLRGYINGTQVISWTDDGSTNGAILPEGYGGVRLRSPARITAFHHRSNSTAIGAQNVTHTHGASSPSLAFAGPLAIASAISAHVATSPSIVGLPIMPPASRFCADRCFHPNSWDGDTARQFDGFTEHKMLTSVASGFKIAYANWWVKSESSYPAATFPTCTEINGTQTLLIRAAIEYPLGTFTEVKWSGSGTLLLAAGATTFSDDIAVIPPIGATFLVHVYGSTNGTGYGIPYYWGNEAVATTAVDAHNYSTASGVTIDYHMQYHPTPAYNQNVMFPPVAIVGVTTAPAVAIIGDSIAHGWLDVANIDEYHGAIGYYSASLVTLGIPHANYAQPAEAGYLFASNSAKRRALINAYASHAICNFWGNDFSAGRTFSQLQTMVTDIAGLIDPQLSWTCAMPATDSTNVWADEAQQTTGGTADENAHTDFNNYLLGGVPGIAHVFNPRPAVQGTVNQHKWKGATPPLTPDGIHLSRAGVNAIVGAGIIDSSIVTYSAIGINGGSHAHAAGSPALTSASPVAATAGMHAHTAGSPAISSWASLAPATAFHAHSAAQPSISAQWTITPSDAVHAMPSTSPAFQATLIVDASHHAHIAGSPALFTSSPLTIADAAHAHGASSLSISANAQLGINGSLHGHMASPASITSRANLAIAAAVHDHVAGSPSLTAVLGITIDDALHVAIASSPLILTAAPLVLADAMHDHSAMFVSAVLPGPRAGAFFQFF